MTTRTHKVTDSLPLSEVPCAFAAEGLCQAAQGEHCGDCQRYNELLREARGLYPDVRWILTPEGMLYGLTER